MKIVCTSNFDDQAKAESLVAENIQFADYAHAMCAALNDKFSGDRSPNFYKLVQDDYRLWRGMEDLVR